MWLSQNHAVEDSNCLLPLGSSITGADGSAAAYCIWLMLSWVANLHQAMSRPKHQDSPRSGSIQNTYLKKTKPIGNDQKGVWIKQFKLLLHISSKSVKACCHWPPFSHEVIAMLKLTTSGWSFSRPIRSNIPRLCRHAPFNWKDAMVELKLTKSGWKDIADLWHSILCNKLIASFQRPDRWHELIAALKLMTFWESLNSGIALQGSFWGSSMLDQIADSKTPKPWGIDSIDLRSLKNSQVDLGEQSHPNLMLSRLTRFNHFEVAACLVPQTSSVPVATAHPVGKHWWWHCNLPHQGPLEPPTSVERKPKHAAICQPSHTKWSLRKSWPGHMMPRTCGNARVELKKRKERCCTPGKTKWLTGIQA